MAGGAGAVDFGAGLAQGLAQAYGNDRANKNQLTRDKELNQMALGRDVLGFLINSGRVSDYNDLMPFVDHAMGNTLGGKPVKPKAGETDPHEILRFALEPLLSGGGAAPAPESSAGAPAASSAVGGPQAVPAAPAASVAGVAPMDVAAPVPAALPARTTPNGIPPLVPDGAPAAGGPASTATSPGIRLLSDGEMIEREVSNQATKTRAMATEQSKLARQFYDQFKGLDPDFTLYDALAMAGFKTDYNRTYSTGSQGILRGLDAFIAQRKAEATAAGQPFGSEEELKARADWMAQARSGGVNREAIARAQYGKAFNQLTETEAASVIKAETALIGQQAYTRTDAGNKADFNAPLTPTQAMATNLPVGTTGPEVKGQGVSTQADIDARRGTENLVTQLTHIDKDLIDAALPDENELGGLLPGAWFALARRGALPGLSREQNNAKRDAIAALEAAVNNSVNVIARNVAQQRGTQTERDAERAEAAMVSLRDQIIKGDTRQTARTRLGETLAVVNQNLAKLPQQAMPTAPGKGGAAKATAPAGATPTADLRAKAKRALVGAGRDSSDASVTKFLQLNPNFK
jgi:hypothetical protein